MIEINNEPNKWNNIPDEVFNWHINNKKRWDNTHDIRKTNDIKIGYKFFLKYVISVQYNKTLDINTYIPFLPYPLNEEAFHQFHSFLPNFYATGRVLWVFTNKDDPDDIHFLFQDEDYLSNALKWQYSKSVQYKIKEILKNRIIWYYTADNPNSFVIYNNPSIEEVSNENSHRVDNIYNT